MTPNAISLTAGRYSGWVDQTIVRDGLIATITGYSAGDCIQNFHYHENAVISFVLNGGNTEGRKAAVLNEKPGILPALRRVSGTSRFRTHAPAGILTLKYRSIF